MNLADYQYPLPDERIAKHPLKERKEAKLLVYRKGQVSHSQFKSLHDHLPPESHLILNDTKVIPARFRMAKQTGALIEVFLLNPVGPSTVISEVMEETHSCLWECMIGNKKRWKGEALNTKVLIDEKEADLQLILIDSEKNYVSFTWNNDQISFAEIVVHAGQIPLPPYLNREAETEDTERYQTVYSKFEGAVAAPTAGLHFDSLLLRELQQKGHTIDYLTLHVGAGTFLPVTVDNVQEHKMHEEQIVVRRTQIQGLIDHIDAVIPVGTTSMRTLESLYWYGVMLAADPKAVFQIPQDIAYRQYDQLPDQLTALQNILAKMEKEGIDHLVGETGIFIYPGYEFKICKGLITNFHQPGSTLILLVAALVGNDWKHIYQAALDGNYRFLSYGDSSLLLP